jgi:hypothetical protein
MSTKGRITWTDRERTLLAEKMLDYMERGYGKMAALRQAQEIHLPADRRRNVPAVTALPWLANYLKDARIRRSPAPPAKLATGEAAAGSASPAGTSPALASLQLALSGFLAECIVSAINTPAVQEALHSLLTREAPLTAAVKDSPPMAAYEEPTDLSEPPPFPRTSALTEGHSASGSSASLAEALPAMEPPATLAKEVPSPAPAIVEAAPSLPPQNEGSKLAVKPVPSNNAKGTKSSSKNTGASKTATPTKATVGPKPTSAQTKASSPRAPALKSAVPQLKILVAGLIGPQIDIVLKKFGALADLRFWQSSESLAQLKRQAKSCAYVIGVTNFMPHSAEGILKDSGSVYVRHPGGVSKLKDTLNAVITGQLTSAESAAA